VSKQFASDVEHGNPTVQLGLVLKMLAELGVPLRAMMRLPCSSILGAESAGSRMLSIPSRFGRSWPARFGSLTPSGIWWCRRCWGASSAR